MQVAAGCGYTVFVTADRLVYTYACGLNDEGQLGVGDREDRLVPALVTGQLQAETAVYAAAGGCHTLCITTDDSLFAWGGNDRGQLGVRDTQDRHVPTLVTGLQTKRVVHVAAGNYHTICSTTGGCVFTLGDGDHGQLGLGLWCVGDDTSVRKRCRHW